MSRHRKEAAKGILASYLICSSLLQENVKKSLRELVQILFKTKPSRNITKIEKKDDNICLSWSELKKYNYKLPLEILILIW